MDEYTKLEDSSLSFTGPIAGQLYVRFLRFEGLDASITSANLPAVSVKIENEVGLHPHLDFNPKKISQVPELLLFLRSRSHKVTIEFRHPQSQEDLGTTTIEPVRVVDARLNTVWFKLGGSGAKVLAHVYWGALHLHDKFTNRLSDTFLTTFSIVLDRPQYLAGETVTGVVVYRPRKEKDLRAVKLQIAGFSRQFSDDDSAHESKQIFFNHEAILMGFPGNATAEALRVNPGYYVWTFAFPLPYAIPSSGLSCGNYYYVAARQVDMAGNISKTLKLTFGLRKTFFPRSLLEAAVDGPIQMPAPVSLTTTPGLAADAAQVAPGAPPPQPQSVEEPEDGLNNVRKSAHVQRLMQSDSSSEDDEDGNSVEEEEHDEVLGASEDSDTDHEDPDADVTDEASDAHELSDEIKATVATDEDGNDTKSGASASKRRRKKKTGASKKKTSTKAKDGTHTEEPASSSSKKPSIKTSDSKSNPVSSKAGRKSRKTPIESATLPSSSTDTDAPVSIKKATKDNPNAYKSATVIATGPDGKSRLVDAPQPALQVTLRVPLRVRPGIAIQVRPSGGMKHLVVPIEIENTTEKPLVQFRVALNCISQKTLWQQLFLGGMRPYCVHAKYLIKRFKFKKEAGWPLAPGAKWSGTVNLALPESVPPTIDEAVSPLFSRTYYVKICSTAKGLFTKHKVETKKVVLVPDYDYHTRPLPIQHAFNQPVRFTIFAMPAMTTNPTVVPEISTQLVDPAAPIAVDIEQSEAVDLDVSTII